jgi:S1-C subfamily serine protease
MPAPAPAPVAPAPPPAAAPLGPKTLPSGALSRVDVDSVLDAGFGRLLARVAVEPALEQGRFRGWTILGLGRGFDSGELRRGDVVRSVNGMPLERETEAFLAFESLRSARELVITYARDGGERTLSYRIVP